MYSKRIFSLTIQAMCIVFNYNIHNLNGKMHTVSCIIDYKLALSLNFEIICYNISIHYNIYIWELPANVRSR